MSVATLACEAAVRHSVSAASCSLSRLGVHDSGVPDLGVPDLAVLGIGDGRITNTDLLTGLLYQHMLASCTFGGFYQK